jgi:hypothetical protein
MSVKYNTEVVLNDAETIATAWTAYPEFEVGTYRAEDFIKERDALFAANKEVKAKRQELKGLMSDRDSQATVVHDLVSRAKLGLQSKYGINSKVATQIGAARMGRRRRAQPATPVPVVAEEKAA